MVARADNHAYILLLIRQGAVKTQDDLRRHFGLAADRTRWTTADQYLDDDISVALYKLSDAGLIEWDPRGSIVKTTPLLAKVQSSLQVSLSALASGTPSNRLIVSPRFRTDLASRYQSDIFVVMPFSAALTALYQDHLRLVAQSLQMTIARADDFFSSEQIMPEVWSAIAKAKVVIADCTGRNPNVFYEIGLAHALGKSVVLITQTPQDVPFDLKAFRCLEYEFTPRGMKAFEDALTKTLKSIFEYEGTFCELRAF